jgi:hypothetical protein
MPRTNEIRVKANNSNPNFAPSSATTVSYEKFLIEKNCKNEAYAFIISQGLFQQFQDYHFSHHSDDPHKKSTGLLIGSPK